jgi:exportin-2 (importin alpha re-exporter)
LNTSRTNGYPLVLLRLIQLGDLSDEAIRQAAAIHFKNIVKKGWDTEREEGNDGILISDQDRTVIKENLVQLMCEVPPSIQAQCAEAISLIAALDFPSKWDSLLPTLVCRFGSDDPRIVNGVLITANSLFKSFRYVQRSDKLYEHILYSLKHVQEPLLLLFKTTDHAVGISSADAKQLKPHLESLRLICRIFFSLNYQDLPEYFEDTMGEWMSIFAKYLEYNNALMTDDDEELEASPIDRLQSAIVENLNLYADKDEETFLPFLPSFTRLVWNLLMRLTIFSKHDILSTKCIRFLASLVKKQMHQDLFKDVSTLRQIIGNIVIPNLRIREVDQERFEDDPAEYIATDIEGSETESRRKCSQELLRAMCRQYEKQTTSICHEHVASMLIEYKNNPSKNWPAKDAAVSHTVLASEKTSPSPYLFQDLFNVWYIYLGRKFNSRGIASERARETYGFLYGSYNSRTAR